MNDRHIDSLGGSGSSSLLKFGVMIASTALQRHCSQSIKPYQGVLNG